MGNCDVYILGIFRVSRFFGASWGARLGGGWNITVQRNDEKLSNHAKPIHKSTDERFAISVAVDLLSEPIFQVYRSSRTYLFSDILIDFVLDIESTDNQRLCRRSESDPKLCSTLANIETQYHCLNSPTP